MRSKSDRQLQPFCTLSNIIHVDVCTTVRVCDLISLMIFTSLTTWEACLEPGQALNAGKAVLNVLKVPV